MTSYPQNDFQFAHFRASVSFNLNDSLFLK